MLLPDVCQENAKMARLGNTQSQTFRTNQRATGRRRADQLAHLLGMDAGMIFTDLKYHCVIGIPPRDHDERLSSVACIILLTPTETQPFPLSSYGLNVTEQGDVRSI